MANVFVLPTQAEVEVTFVIDGKEFKTDPIYINDMLQEAIEAEYEATKKSTNDGYKNYFMSLFNGRHGDVVTINKVQAWAMVEYCQRQIVDWKKKLFPSPELSVPSDPQKT